MVTDAATSTIRAGDAIARRVAADETIPDGEGAKVKDAAAAPGRTGKAAWIRIASMVVANGAIRQNHSSLRNIDPAAAASTTSRDVVTTGWPTAVSGAIPRNRNVGKR